jgi:hypothetical protein
MSLDVSKYLQSPPSVTASDMVGIIVNMYFTVSRKVSAFMLGPPGVGKSQSVEEAADAIGVMLSSLSQQLSYIAYTKFTDAMEKCSVDERELLKALADESGITKASQGKKLDDVVLETLIKNIRRIAILALVRSPLVFANINLKEGNTYTGIMDFVIPTAMINQVIGTDVFPPYSEALISDAKLLFPTLGMNERLRSTLATSLISDEYMRVSGATTLFSDVINALGSCRGIIGLFFAFARLFKQGITYETLKSLIKMRLDRKVVETFDSYFYLFEPPYQTVAQKFNYPVSKDMTDFYSHEYMPASCDYFAVNKNLTLMSMGVRRVLITANGEMKFDAELGDLYVPYTALPVYEELRDIYNFLSRYREFLNIGIHKYGETHIEEPFEKSLAGAKVCLFNYLDFRLSQLELEDIKGVPSDIAARYLALVLFGKRGETETYEKGGEQAAQKIKEEVFKYLTLPYSVVRSLESTKAVWLAPPWLLREGFGILFLDELNLAPYYMQAAAYQIVLDRRISTGHELSSGIFVIAAGNNVDWASEIAKELPYPLRNRFAIFYVYAQPYSFLEWATYYANIMPTLLKMYLGTVAMGGETGVKTIRESMALLERPWSPEMYGENYILVTPRSFEMASYMINLTAYNTARVVTSNPLLFASPETKSLGEIVSDINKSGDVVSAMINDMVVRLATVSPSVFTYLMQSIILRASSVLGVDYGAQFALALLSGGLLSAMQVLGLNLLASLSPDKVKERPVAAIQDVVGCLANIGRAFAPLSALLSIPNIKEKIRGLFSSALSIAGSNASLFTEELIAMLDSIYGIYNINERKTYSDVANDVANHLAITINLALSTLTAYAFARHIEDYYYLIRAYLVSKLFEETLRSQQQQQAQPQAQQLPEISRTIITSLLYGTSTGEPLSSVLLSLIQAKEFIDMIENVVASMTLQRRKGLRAASEATGPIEMLKKELKEKPNMWNAYKYFVEAFGGAEGPYIRAWNDRLKVAVGSVCPNLTSYM